MAHVGEVVELPVRRLEAVPRNARLLTVGFVILGAVVFLTALFTDSARAWRAYHYNWLFTMGVAQGAVMLAVVTTIAKGLWSRPLRRIALSFVAYLPVAYLLMIPMLFAAEHIFPWVDEPVHGKEVYLNVPFLAVRHIVGLAVLFGLSVLFASWALRPDLGVTTSGVPDRFRGLYGRMTRGWLGAEAEELRASRRVGKLAPIMALVYALVMGVVAWDFIMSLEPHWFSTLIGPYFFMGSFLGGIAATALLTLFYRSVLGLHSLVHPPQLHDLGKLTFGFCIFWAYLLWSQYLVIWYGMLPIEQVFVIHRLSPPFNRLSILVFLCLFVFPFAGLLGVTPKKRPELLATFAGVVLFGLWLERYVLVYPSHYHTAEAPPFGWIEVGTTLLFIGLLLASLFFFAVRFPMVQRWISEGERELLGPGKEAIDQVVTAE